MLNGGKPTAKDRAELEEKEDGKLQFLRVRVELMEKVAFKHRQTSVIEKSKPRGQLRKDDFRKREEEV